MEVNYYKVKYYLDLANIANEVDIKVNIKEDIKVNIKEDMGNLVMMELKYKLVKRQIKLMEYIEHFNNHNVTGLELVFKLKIMLI